MSIERFEGEDIDLALLKAAILSVPFLASKKLITIQSVAQQKGLHEDLMEVLGDIPESTEVILYDPALDKRTSFYKFLKSSSAMKEHKELDEMSLMTWVGEQDIEMDRVAVRTLVQRVGPDQWALHHELEKLRHVSGPITSKVIEDVVALNPRDTIFEMLDSTMQGKHSEALATYRRLQTLKIEAHYVLSMVSWQLHIFALLVYGKGQSTDTIASRAKVSAYVLSKSQPAARRLSPVVMNAVLDMCIEADTLIKSSPIDANIVVEQLIGRIANSMQHSAV